MMKRYLSVFGLAARSSFWQGLALMIVSVALAGALLYLTPGSGPYEITLNSSIGRDSFPVLLFNQFEG